MLQALETIEEILWGPMTYGILLGAGICFMIRLRLLPIRNIVKAIGFSFEKEDNQDGISGLSALLTELASTIGVGNIVGVAGAILLGGPGALVWMMGAGLLGLAVKLVECYLVIYYRPFYCTKGEAPVGGPMFVYRGVLGDKKWGRALGFIYALLCMLSAIGMGNMVQANSVVETCAYSLRYPWIGAFIGLFMGLSGYAIIQGGLQRISGVMRLFVPMMCFVYILACVWIIFCNLGRIPAALGWMLEAAFSRNAIFGGIYGGTTIAIGQCIRQGIMKGVFSNEAGIGTSSIIAAGSGKRDGLKQAYISMTSVFYDTLVLCFITGLTILVSGILGLDNSGQEVLYNGNLFMISMFQLYFGQFGIYFYTGCICLFAFATIIAWEYAGEVSFQFCFGRNRSPKLFRIVYSSMIFLGAVLPLRFVWTLASICNGLMIYPNLFLLFTLGAPVMEAIIERGRKF